MSLNDLFVATFSAIIAARREGVRCLDAWERCLDLAGFLAARTRAGLWTTPVLGPTPALGAEEGVGLVLEVVVAASGLFFAFLAGVVFGFDLVFAVPSSLDGFECALSAEKGGDPGTVEDLAVILAFAALPVAFAAAIAAAAAAFWLGRGPS